MTTIPYSLRVTALVLLAAAVVLHDRFARQGQGGKHWEYGFIFLVGGLGALCGAVNDAITSELSPAYFVIGKGLAGVGSIKQQAVILGAQAGFSASVIAFVSWQFVLRRLPARERCLLVLKHLWVPLALAALLGILLPLAFRQSDPFHFAARFADTLSAEDLPGFLTVWWIHLGVYAGLVAGVGVGMGLTRQRKPPARCNPPT